jgi:hypothetical protein
MHAILSVGCPQGTQGSSCSFQNGRRLPKKAPQEKLKGAAVDVKVGRPKGCPRFASSDQAALKAVVNLSNRPDHGVSTTPNLRVFHE